MDLFEYQARDIFEKHGVPVLGGVVATTPEEAREGAEKLGGGTVVVKAQVKTGGRGKAGGVKLAHSPDETAEKAGEILGMDIKGHTVHRVMIAQGAKIAEEFYFSVLLDRSNRNYLAMCSVEGGMEIEQLAVERPEALARVAVDPAVGIDEAKAAEIVDAAGFADDIKGKVAEVIRGLWTVFKAEDATLVEVNPLVKTEDGEIVALDGKVTLDENAGFRHPDHADLEDSAAADPLEAKAKENDLNYVKLDGEVGIIGNGAGLVMSTLDVVAYAGEKHGGVKPANFLDIGGGANAQGHGERPRRHPGRRAGQGSLRERLRRHHRLRRGSERHRRCARPARRHATKPLVVRLDGNNVELGRQILDRAQPPARHPCRHHGRRRRQGCRAGQRLIAR